MTPPVTNARDAHLFFTVAEALADESRRDIVGDIVAHLRGLPSMKELEFTTGLHRTTIREHLETLIDAGLVELVAFRVGKQRKRQPSQFYGIAETAREFFNRNNIFIEDHWREMYNQVDKPEEIKQAEVAPRPDLDTGD